MICILRDIWGCVVTGVRRTINGKQSETFICMSQGRQFFLFHACLLPQLSCMKTADYVIPFYKLLLQQ